MDCKEIKSELLRCLQNYDIGYNQKFLELSVKKRQEDIKAFKIDQKILDKCEYRKLANCLEEKYAIAKMNEKLLYEFYQSKYVKMKAEQERTAIQNNLVLTGKDDKMKK
jgi:hypothetical protein